MRTAAALLLAGALILAGSFLLTYGAMQRLPAPSHSYPNTQHISPTAHPGR